MGFFHPGNSHLRASELLATTLRARPASVRRVFVAELLVRPAIVRVVRGGALLDRTTKLLPELTCKPHAEYLRFLSSQPQLPPSNLRFFEQKHRYVYFPLVYTWYAKILRGRSFERQDGADGFACIEKFLNYGLGNLERSEILEYSLISRETCKSNRNKPISCYIVLCIFAF